MGARHHGELVLSHGRKTTLSGVRDGRGRGLGGDEKRGEEGGEGGRIYE